MATHHRTCVGLCLLALPLLALIASLPASAAAPPYVPSSTTTLSDAELLALEISGALLPPAELVDQVAADLAAIRLHNPYFTDFHVYPSWLPGVLLIELSPEAWESHLLGEYHGWDELNAQYGVSVDPDTYPRPRYVRLTFTPPYNPAVLAEIYAGIPGILRSTPSILWDGIIDIFAEVPSPGVYTGIYTFQEGWTECGPEGCYLRYHYWVFSISSAGVELTEDYGSPLAVESTTWGVIKQQFRDR